MAQIELKEKKRGRREERKELRKRSPN